MSSTSQKLNFSFPLKPILLAVFSIALLLLIASYAFKQFGYFSLILDFSILINLFVLLSWKYSFSLPIFSKQLRNKYAELKRYLDAHASSSWNFGVIDKISGIQANPHSDANPDANPNPNSIKPGSRIFQWLHWNSRMTSSGVGYFAYYLKLLQFKIIYYLAILFYDLESATNILKDGDNPFGIEFSSTFTKGGARGGLVKSAYLQEFFTLMEQKKQRATILAVSVSSATIALALIVITILSNPTSAATFGWTQTDWSGGATSSTATHPGDKTGWNKYWSMDSGLEASSSVALALYSSTTIDTISADFTAGSSTNTYVLNNNLVLTQCGTELVAGVGGPYDANGITTTTGGYYRTVQIASSTDPTQVQCWFKDNLNAGTMIGSFLADHTTLQDQNNNGTIEKYCYGYNHTGDSTVAPTADCKAYGGLYQWSEAVQYSNGVTTSTGTTVASGNIQGICPTGWHVPSDTEFTILSNYLGGDSIAGGKMKATTTASAGSTWLTPNTGADNSSGFTALSNGYRGDNGSFNGRSISALFWSSLPNVSANALRRSLAYNDTVLDLWNFSRASGVSIRCLKNTTSTPANITPNVGTFTSAVKDFGVKVNLGAFSWNASTTNGVTAVTMQVRTGDVATTTDASWSAWTTVTSGATPDATLSGKRYLQYRATMTSNDLNTVPTLNDVSIAWGSYDRNYAEFTRVSPTMTSNVLPSPYIVTSTAHETIRLPWRAFNTVIGDNGDTWGGKIIPAWLKIDMSSTSTVSSYRVAYNTNMHNSGGDFKTWTFQGSNDDTNWTILDTQTSAPAWTVGEIRTYYLTNLAVYRYYKWNITSAQNSATYVGTDELALGYTPTTLVSSPYDSGSSANIIPKVAWTGNNTSTDNTIKLQIRSSASTTTLESAPWCGYDDTAVGCTGTNYFEYNEINKQITDLTHPLISGGDDRYFQYRIVLASGGTSTPSVSDVLVTYVVNAAPEFTSSTTATQRTSDGKVQIDFSALDSDTASSGVGCPDCVISTLERSIDNGNTWTAIPVDRLSTPDGYNLGFGTSTIATATSTYRILWDPKASGEGTLDGTYSTNTKIRITLNDKEGGNNTVVTTTPAFVLDVENPVMATHPIIINAHGAVVNDPLRPATTTLSATDDTTGLQMCVTLDATYASCSYSLFSTTTTIMLTADPKRVYVAFKDSFNNTSTASVINPDTPNNIIIKDVSDTLIPTYQEFIVWKAVVSDIFKYYHVEHSTDGVTWTQLDLVDDPTVNFYFHQELVKDSTHYYRVYTEDDYGNTSFYTTAVNDSADGVGGTNPNPPVLSNVEVTATTTQSATIEWDTNELANSSVHYSTDAFTDITTFNLTALTAGSLTMAQDATHIDRHRVTLTGLTPGLTYNFTVESQNALTVSGTNTNENDGYSFTTLNGPTISNVTANSVTNNGATIIWNTNDASDSTVYYTTSSLFTSFDNTGVSTAVTSHEVVLTGLLRGTVYYYYVKSGVATDNNVNNYYTFTTPSDNVAPVISNATSSIVIDTQAVINWTTNEMSDSEVVYGTVSGIYNLSATDTNLNTNHNVILSNLATSTTYYFKVISTDASGNEASSTTELPFTTLETLSQESAVALRESLAEAAGAIAGAAAKVCVGGGGSTIDRSKPVISAVAVSEVTGDSATFSWVTDKVGSSLIEYGKDINYGNEASKFKDSLTNHILTVKYLNPSTLYHYRVASIDANGNLGQSTDATFTTTDTLGLSDLSDPASSQATKNSDFVFSLNKINEYLRTMSKVVSLDVLETTLNSQYDTIRSLSDTVPPPVLSGEPRVLTTSDTATVTWKTDKNSNSLVALAPESKYDKSKGSEAYLQTVGNSTESVTTHIVTINDLEPETLYHYQVRSMLDIGSLGQSADFIFLTKPKQLEISNYTIEKLNGSTAVFKWLTNNETDGSVKFTPYRNGILAIDSSNSVKNKNYTTLHEIKVDSFESGINYEVELSGKDIKGQIISKKISTFSTGEDNFPPTIYQVQTESALSTGKESNVQTIISWLTDEPSTAQAFYQKGVGTVKDDAWEKTPIDPNYSKKHIIVLTKFEPGQIYQFKLQSADSNNNIGVSKVYTILAPKQKESVFQVIMKNFEEVFGWTQKINK